MSAATAVQAAARLEKAAAKISELDPIHGYTTIVGGVQVHASDILELILTIEKQRKALRGIQTTASEALS